MPKSQFVDPKKAFEPGFIHFEDIPVCQYNKTLEEEKKIYSKEDFLRIYRDMAIIHEFETMDDSYFQERAADVRDVTFRLLYRLAGRQMPLPSSR